MSLVRILIPTVAEAKAFAAGVDFVDFGNDVGLRVRAIEQVGGNWVVVLEDDDAIDVSDMVYDDGHLRKDVPT